MLLGCLPTRLRHATPSQPPIQPSQPNPAPTRPCRQGRPRSVGALKFGSVRELLQAGFHPLLMDLDLFLVAADPLADMRPLG
jgi:hypothetical protein